MSPAWAAAAGAAVLAGRALAQHRTTLAAIARAAAVPFLAFVLSLGIVVRAVTGNGLAGAPLHRRAICPVLLVWPQPASGPATIPPAPPRPPHHQ